MLFQKVKLFNICLMYISRWYHMGGHGGRVVTLWPPTSEAGVRFPARPQVGKLVVACCWSAVYSTEPRLTVCTGFLCPQNYPLWYDLYSFESDAKPQINKLPILYCMLIFLQLFFFSSEEDAYHYPISRQDDETCDDPDECHQDLTPSYSDWWRVPNRRANASA